MNRETSVPGEIRVAVPVGQSSTKSVRQLPQTIVRDHASSDSFSRVAITRARSGTAAQLGHGWSAAAIWRISASYSR